jgi:hypothetical protein
MKRLSQADQDALPGWLTNVLEGESELTEEFKAEIKRGEADIAAARFRIRRPDPAM